MFLLYFIYILNMCFYFSHLTCTFHFNCCLNKIFVIVIVIVISDTCNQVSMGLDLQALAAAQSTCQDTQSYRTAITGILWLMFLYMKEDHHFFATHPHQNPDPSCHQVTVVTCLTCFTDCHIPALAHLKNLYAVVTCGMV